MDKQCELDIKIFIARELANGTSLSDIQNMVNETFNQRMTYMDIRILASSLDVDWKSLDPNAQKSVENKEDEPAGENGSGEAAETAGTAPAAEGAAGETVVDVSPIARPGMMLSGSVKFASGSTAEWYVDNMGRLGLENLVGNQPDENDVKQFRIELDKAVRKVMGQ